MPLDFLTLCYLCEVIDKESCSDVTMFGAPVVLACVMHLTKECIKSSC
jgi:hypothetical protein